MNFDEAALRVSLNRSLAFFGSGFSRDATNVAGQLIPSVDWLEKHFSTAVGEIEQLPLDLAAQEYVRKRVDPDIRTFLSQQFTAAKVEPHQEHISTLPWRRVYTTNYDDVIEHSRKARSLPTTSVTSFDEPQNVADDFTVVHLHGFVERLSQQEWDQTYVLTNTQYASDILRESGWLETFRYDAAYADAIFFFGYSMADLDIARLMYENPSVTEKTFFVTGRSVSRATAVRVSGYGTLVDQDVADIAAKFPVAGAPDAPRPAPFLASLEKRNTPPAVRRPGREDVLSYLVKGDSSIPFIKRDLVSGTHEYFVSRDQVNMRASGLGDRPERLLVHSDLGNGKTGSLVEFDHHFATAGWDVLWFSGDKDGFKYDLDYLSSLGSLGQSKVAVFIENCFSFSNEVKQLITRFPLISLVLTTRSAALQTRVADLAETFGEDFEVLDLDSLSPEEARDFDAILFDNGLWGEKQGLSEAERLKYIAGKCRYDLATLLVDVCRSSDIFARVKEELGALDSHPYEIKKPVIATLCLSYAGARLSVAQICDLVQADLFKYGKYQRDPAILEFIDFDSSRVIARSSTFARAVLKDIVPDHLLIGLIPDLLRRLDQLKGTVPLFNESVKQMMRFGYIEQILSDENKEQKLVSFFEAVRATGVGVSNPQFWLQYAIACMSFSDYENAERNFNTAFGLAGNRGGYDPYQIENQHARFLLESRSRSARWGDYFDSFHSAHDIVARQMNNFTEGFYPYRVAILYLEFVEANNGKMTRDQLLRISEWCSQLLMISERAPSSIKRSAYWRRARESLKHTKDFITETT